MNIHFLADQFWTQTPEEVFIQMLESWNVDQPLLDLLKACPSVLTFYGYTFLTCLLFLFAILLAFLYLSLMELKVWDYLDEFVQIKKTIQRKKFRLHCSCKLDYAVSKHSARWLRRKGYIVLPVGDKTLVSWGFAMPRTR